MSTATVSQPRPSPFDRLTEQRILVLGESVDEESANRLVAQLLVLSAEDAESDICLFINSPGGSVMDGLAVYDTMQLIPNDVATVAIGFAAELARIRSQAEAILAGHTGRSVEQVRADTDRALVLTGTDAVGYGIVDDVLIADRSSGEQHRAAATALRPDA